MLNRLPITYHLLIRFFIISLFLASVVFVVGEKLYFTSLFIVLVLLLLLAESFFYIKSKFSFYNRTLQAILNDDFSADYSRHKNKKQYKSLFAVYDKLKGNTQEIISKELIYNTILNNVETGILILKKDENDWVVNLLNDYLSTNLAIPKVTKWSYLKRLAPKLCKAIEINNFEEFKTTIQIQVKKQEIQTYVLQVSKTITYEKEFVVVLLESVQKLVDRKEKEAWINLMKVISHELLNSLTPIQTLSQNMYETFTTEIPLTDEDYDDLKQSAYTMLNRSNHLQQFVESYRKLAMLPLPNRNEVSLKRLVYNCLFIMQPTFEKEEISLTNKVELNRTVFVDEKQIEQVIINLLTNSIYALKNKKDKQVLISSEIKDKRLFIHISDNGKGIEKQIQDKIFLPFFTTRSGGGGIGLTLSKSIIEAHNGYLIHNYENGFTKFSIVFL